MITTILFDKDGTLFDFRATWSGFASAFFMELGGGDQGRASEMAWALGFDLGARVFEDDSPLIAGTPGDIAELLLPHVPGTTPAALLSRMNVLAANAPQQEAAPLAPLLAGLRRRGLTLGVITNDAMSIAKSHLRAAGVLHYFERVIGCDCGFGQKPDPGQLSAFMEITGAEPHQTVMVGDSPQDLRAARAAGCTSLGVLTGVSPARKLKPLADAILPSIAALPEWIDRRGPRRLSIDAA